MENGDLLSNGETVSVWSDEKIQEMKSHDGCTIVTVVHVTELYTGSQVHTAIFNMDNQQGPIVYSTGNSAQPYVQAWMGRGIGEIG